MVWMSAADEGGRTKKTRTKKNRQSSSSRCALSSQQITDILNSFSAANSDADADADNKMECVYEASEEAPPLPTPAATTTTGTTTTSAPTPTFPARSVCNRCNTLLVIGEEGHLECTNSQCGCIVRGAVDQSAEWRFYGADGAPGSDPTRCGMPINPYFEESSYGCKVVHYGKTSYEMIKVGRYAKWMSMPYRENKLYEDMQHITVYSRIAGISQKLIDDAHAIYAKLAKSDQNFRGNNHEDLIASSVYLACLHNHCPRTVKEIATIFHRSPSEVSNGCKLAQRILSKMAEQQQSSPQPQHQPADFMVFHKAKPENFIERYCSNLNLGCEATQLAKFVARRVAQLDSMPENTPSSVAAAIIYFVTKQLQLPTTKHDVNRVSDISEVTISKCCKKLEAIKHTLIPQQFIQSASPPPPQQPPTSLPTQQQEQQEQDIKRQILA